MLGDWKSDAVLLYLTVPLDIRIKASNLIANLFRVSLLSNSHYHFPGFGLLFLRSRIYCNH